MKRGMILLLAAALALTHCLYGAGNGARAEEEGLYYDGTYYYYSDSGTAPVLTSLTHNCAETGILLPPSFQPGVTSYLLTVADWVSRVSLTPVASDPSAVITVNGTIIRSGSSTSYFKMTDRPLQVTIDVANGFGATHYTVFLQRRPSERRTKVSAGGINKIYRSGSQWVIDADLGTVQYMQGNQSTYQNKTAESYPYPCAKNCILYFGDIDAPVRAFDMEDFLSQYNPDALYRFIYLEGEIVAVLPYAPDY